MIILSFGLVSQVLQRRRACNSFVISVSDDVDC